MNQTTIVAKVFVINPQGLILTLMRSKNDDHRPSTWDLPGGSVEYGEDPTEAVIREANEKAGLKLKDPKIFSTKTTNSDKHVVRLLYYVHLDPVKVTLSNEHEDYKWVSKEEFYELDIPQFYKVCLQQLLS